MERASQEIAMFFQLWPTTDTVHQSMQRDRSNLVNKSILALLFVVIAFSAVSINVNANKTHTDIHERVQNMQKLERAMTVLEALSTENAASLKPFIEAANEIQKHSGQNMIGLFPVSSNSSQTSSTRQMDWGEWEKFKAYALRLHLLSESLRASLKYKEVIQFPESKVALPPVNPDKMLAGVEMPDMAKLSKYPAIQLIPLIRKNCNSCHAEFRVSNN